MLKKKLPNGRRVDANRKSHWVSVDCLTVGYMAVHPCLRNSLIGDTGRNWGLPGPIRDQSGIRRDQMYF